MLLEEPLLDAVTAVSGTGPAYAFLLSEAMIESALREGRYELAARLARQRLDLSDSPAARRVLAALPPDLGD